MQKVNIHLLQNYEKVIIKIKFLNFFKVQKHQLQNTKKLTNKMVFVQYKKSQKNNFTIQCSGNMLVGEVLQKIIEINNLRIYLDRLLWSVQQLANKGVLRPHQLQGISYQQFQKHKQQFKQLSQEKLQYATKPIVQPPYKFVADKHFQRHGIVLPEDQQKIILNAVKKARTVMQPKKQITEIQQILNAIQQIRNAVMEAYPAYIGLPQWEPTLLILEEKLELQVLASQNIQLYDQKSIVWWAGKQLDKKKPLTQYSGKNEKTKIIIKLQKFGGQQPPREPPIDAETYNKMVKFYYKKVEQNKKFDQNAVEHHYQKIQTQSMKEKLYLQDSLRFKPF